MWQRVRGGIVDVNLYSGNCFHLNKRFKNLASLPLNRKHKIAFISISAATARCKVHFSLCNDCYKFDWYQIKILLSYLFIHKAFVEKIGDARGWQGQLNRSTLKKVDSIYCANIV